MKINVHLFLVYLTMSFCEVPYSFSATVTLCIERTNKNTAGDSNVINWMLLLCLLLFLKNILSAYFHAVASKTRPDSTSGGKKTTAG